MGQIVIAILSALSLTLTATTQNIERAFLQNNAKLLYSYFPERSYINIALPEPVSFSDYVSNQQAYFLFKRIFSSYTTFQFFSDRETIFIPRRTVIFKARWSFLDRKTDNQHVYFIYFYLTFHTDGINHREPVFWKIREIRVEVI
ncbi:MAG: hypothetical protein KJ727_12325 [Acidobacteria bacterium]|nr:hypothetical protein [Acidobacteriota bacterium]MBU4329475.1 hypothetical protein [Acidobacteriota bacterium]MBU4494680.1 hypothetical protein [Acidobacteriota bacterium]MCG2816591.1 hypothetical protein [Candidatus Aminicenantes bacterium]